jgi:hypothetical protein
LTRNRLSRRKVDLIEILTIPGIRRRVIVVAAALLCLVAADLTVRGIKGTLQQYDGSYEPGEHRRKLSELRALPAGRIVLMGSSRVQFALVPEEFERLTRRSAFNLGISGSFTADWQVFARRLIAGHRPRLVILGVNANSFRPDYLPTKAAYLLFDFHDLIDSIGREGPSWKVLRCYTRQKVDRMWTWFGRRRELRMLGEEALAWLLPKQARQARELRLRFTRETSPDGFAHPEMVGRKVETLQQVLDVGGNVHFPQYDVPRFDAAASPFGRFDALLSTFRESEITVVVAYVPNSPRAEARWSRVEPKIKNRISAICRDHGVPFLALDQNQLPRTNSDYFDEIHVTLPMARRISRYLAQHIEAQHLLEAPATRLAQSEAPSSTP